MTTTVAIHVDGGSSVGLGHAARGVALAAALRARGGRPLLLVASDSGLGEFLTGQGCETAMCVPTAAGLLAACRAAGSAALVIDSYRVTDADLALLTGQLRLVVCFDDTAERTLPVDVVVNGSPAADTLPYTRRPQTCWLLGASYQVVRPEFVTSGRRARGEPRSVVVIAGGADPLGILAPLEAFFATWSGGQPAGVHVDVVVGPFAAPWTAAASSRVRRHRAPRDIHSLMAAADAAVSAGGQTLYELARCGTPTVAFCVGADQVPNLEALARLGVIEYVGWATADDWLARIATALDRLWTDREARERLSRRASELIDGQGGARVAEAIAGLLATKTATAVGS